MASSSLPVPLEKTAVLPDPISPSSGLWSWAAPMTSQYNRFATWRRDVLGLTNPGTAENLQREVKSTHATNFMFDGARADLTKALSVNPLFHVTHSFSLASQTAPAQYSFGAVFANNDSFLQGGVDHDGNVTARLNRGWSPSHITKMQAQVASSPDGNSLLQLEHDFQGSDFSMNVKAVNPDPTDLSGIYIGNYLQSVTQNLALGIETLYQRSNFGPMGMPGMKERDISSSYLAKYTGTNKDWIATAQFQSAGILQSTYWHKLSDKLEVAADLQLIAAPQRRDAIATVGAKYSLRQAAFRAQVDSTGKVSALLEQQLAPTFTFLVAGEIDHAKNASKIGVGIMIESSSLTPEEAGMPPGTY